MLFSTLMFLNPVNVSPFHNTSLFESISEGRKRSAVGLQTPGLDLGVFTGLPRPSGRMSPAEEGAFPPAQSTW